MPVNRNRQLPVAGVGVDIGTEETVSLFAGKWIVVDPCHASLFSMENGLTD